jgi:AraC-like DNA-binding protein
MKTVNTRLPRRQVVAKKKSYVGEFQWLTEDLIHFERIDDNQWPYAEVDTNPDHWVFFVAYDLKPGLVGVQTSSGYLELKGNLAIWFPPYSIVEWNISPGQFQWYGFISAATPPFHLPSKAIVFDYTGKDLPKTKDEVFSRIAEAQTPVVIERESKLTKLAAQLKASIQDRFREDLPIAQLAQEFGVSHEYLVRIFKKTYGITPVYLRSRLRVFSTLLPLLSGREVTDVANSSGFSDLGRFTKQFSKMMKAPPLHFQRTRTS